ncbi:TIGR01777 family oxidoreductase [Gaetbulibacter aestuarii]|uniref:TIGR01777 family oxidoreductase n=1 Tax=Gaetbulibacter aestuarii TaxID=1502358 RepID=A0ABW7MYZ2_9FLAO
MRVLITGATGLIGKHVVSRCKENGIAIHYLTTRKSKLESNENYKGFYWDPDSGEIDKSCFDGVDAIIHLAGASISKRWTSAYKKEILDSRVKPTHLLIQSLIGEKHHVKHVISASAIGVYPDSLVNYYDETFTDFDHESFLTLVVNKWEEAVDGFKELGIEVSKIRIGLVLAKEGGALPSMAKPIKFGVGSAFGKGKQWQSWIHIHDLSEMFIRVLQDELYGIYNGVAPNPVTNNDLVLMIAKVLNKPLLLPNIPEFVMRILLGEMHVILYASQRVSSQKIESEGFQFKYHRLEPALEDLLLKSEDQ